MRLFISFCCLVFLCVPAAQANQVPVPTEKPALEKSIEQFNVKTKKTNSFWDIFPSRKPDVKNETSSSTPPSKTSSDHQAKAPHFSDKKGVFSDRQAALYRDIFRLQEKGEIDGANKQIKKLNTSLLMGHVLAERYLHPTTYRSSYQELKSWLSKYADHPQADAIYKLALIKNPKAQNTLPKPRIAKKISGNLGSLSKRAKSYKSTKRRDEAQHKRVQKLKNDIRRHLGKEQPTLSFNILNNDYALRFMDDVEYDRLRADIAAAYLFSGKSNLAYKLATDSFKRSKEYVPLAGWVKGLIDWQNGNFKAAARAFESPASSAYASGWLVSASAYWASRAHLRSRNNKQVSKWLEVSANYPRTFYGLLAAHSLGRVSNFNWAAPALQQSHINFLSQLPKGKRAIALIKAEKKDLAEQELQTLVVGSAEAGQNALIAFASHYNLPSVLMRLGNAYYQPQGSLYNSALYPVPSWEPHNGFRVDRALIYAIARQESRFNTLAQNPSGATGLMQLMPATANYISGKNIYDKAVGQYQLKKPSANLQIGQKYVEQLLRHPAVKNDLLSMIMAYNAGPGNLSKWKRQRKHIKDPLLFIETIPFPETRAFVERVMANYWIYQIRLNQETASLQALAEGRWAGYQPQDKDVRKVAFKN